MKKLCVLTALLLSCGLVSTAREFNIDSCQHWARLNYPLIRQYEVIGKIADFNVSNASRAWLPQLSLSGQGTYQSEVVSFPDDMEALFQAVGMEFEGIHKDQYKVVLELNQAIWDGGVSKASKRMAEAEKEVSIQTMETELYALRDRINQIYFGILILDEQIKQNKIVIDILENNYATAKTGIESGVTMESDLNKIKAEILSAGQGLSKIENTRKAYVQVLALMTGMEMDGTSEFLRPVGTAEEVLAGKENNRPELALIDARMKSLDAQVLSVNASVTPKFGFFAQGIYGYPGFNMFNDMLEYRWSPNFMVGIRFQWDISGFYYRKNNLRKLDASRDQLQIEKDKFLYNNRIESMTKETELTRLREVMEEDEEIIQLRSMVRSTSETELKNGTITVNDLLKDIADESKAKLDKSIHELEYLKCLYELKTIING